MESIVYNASIVPRKENETDLSWILNTRKYLRYFEARSMYQNILAREVVEKVTSEDWIKAKNLQKDRDIILSLFISAPDYDHTDINTYLAAPETKELGLALAIEFEDFKSFHSVGLTLPNLILYLENNILNQEELNLIKNDEDIIRGLFKRVVDKDKIMFHNLVKNLLNIFKTSTLANLSDIVTSKNIGLYIEHGNYYNHDEFLEFLLKNFPEKHPLFQKQYFMQWDSFTKSRFFSKWLRAKSICLEISRYYMDIDSNNETFQENKEFLQGFLRYQEYCKD
ncbi:hypothetical protein ACUM6W_15540 [Acinetobacter tandoii]|jgi:hypothetical protein|uniref:hypothetical protein n=1 Tax=Acinetobacter tandoii TaxID=202954 RepID=UPI00404675F0